MASEQITNALRKLYEAVERLRETEGDVEIRPDWDFSTRPPERRAEAGFLIFIPLTTEHTYAEVHLRPSEGGFVTPS